MISTSNAARRLSLVTASQSCHTGLQPLYVGGARTRPARSLSPQHVSPRSGQGKSLGVHLTIAYLENVALQFSSLGNELVFNCHRVVLREDLKLVLAG